MVEFGFYFIQWPIEIYCNGYLKVKLTIESVYFMPTINWLVISCRNRAAVLQKVLVTWLHLQTLLQSAPPVNLV